MVEGLSNVYLNVIFHTNSFVKTVKPANITFSKEYWLEPVDGIGEVLVMFRISVGNHDSRRYVSRGMHFIRTIDDDSEWHEI